MEPEPQKHGQAEDRSEPGRVTHPASPQPISDLQGPRDLYWALVGPDGIRAGWLVLLFYSVFRLFLYVFSGFAYAVAPNLFGSEVSPLTAVASELVYFFAMLGAGTILLTLAHHRPADYNLRDSKGLRHFVSGSIIGFLALTALICILAIGGWLHFGPATMRPSRILLYGAVWGFAFLLVGCFEEGTFRCYGLWTLARSINFWWALTVVAGLCLYTYLFRSGDSTLGVYLFAALGLIPSLFVHFKKAEGSRFWQAAWATSTGFGFIHTLNRGENWIGIFAAACIGFVFCVSVWMTGSAWWAIGCHAAWDWTETYFYGTADSGFVARGHLFSTHPAGNPLWSGGTDGPEGSLLIIPVVLLMLAWLLIIYRRPRPAELSAPARAMAG